MVDTSRCMPVRLNRTAAAVTMEVSSGGDTCCLCRPSAQSPFNQDNTLYCRLGYGSLSPRGQKALPNPPIHSENRLVADQNGFHAIRETTTGNHRSKVHLRR